MPGYAFEREVTRMVRNRGALRAAFSAWMRRQPAVQRGS